EGALERRDAAGRADQEAVRKALRHPEARAAEMIDHGLLLRGGRRVEGVELRLAEELAVAGRSGILDVGEEGLEPVAVADIEAHHHTMALAGGGAAEIDRVLPVGRGGVGHRRPGCAVRDPEGTHRRLQAIAERGSPGPTPRPLPATPQPPSAVFTLRRVSRSLLSPSTCCCISTMLEPSCPMEPSAPPC